MMMVVIIKTRESDSGVMVLMGFRVLVVMKGVMVVLVLRELKKQMMGVVVVGTVYKLFR